MGEEDHLKQAIRELGELHLWRLAIQPGKPLAFGEVNGTPWIGLPGNPAAALVTSLVVARPFLRLRPGLHAGAGHAAAPACRLRLGARPTCASSS